MAVMIQFFVPGIPKSTQTGSVIRAGKRLIPTRRNTPWAAAFGLVARQYKPSCPLTTAVRVWMRFQFVRPKSVPMRHWPIVRPDLENLCKGLTDSLNGVFWQDDAQITSLWLTKTYAEKAGVLVTIWKLPLT